jgi:hypothetical protein
MRQIRSHNPAQDERNEKVMFSRLRNRIAFVVCGIVSASGLATGVFAACDGHYCNVDTTGCTPVSPLGGHDVHSDRRGHLV